MKSQSIMFMNTKVWNQLIIKTLTFNFPLALPVVGRPYVSRYQSQLSFSSLTKDGLQSKSEVTWAKQLFLVRYFEIKCVVSLCVL